MNRRLPLRRLAVAAAAVVLAGCGQVHPGAAAMVGDTRISFDEVDDLSDGYCRATVAFAESQGTPPSPVEGVDSRRTVFGLLLSLELARQAADQLDVDVAPNAYVPDPENYQPLVELAGEEYEDDIKTVFEINDEAIALQIAIGANQLDQEVSEAEATAQQEAGRGYVSDYAEDVDIDIDPRLGLSADIDDLLTNDATAVSAGSGSLSVPVSEEAVLPEDPTDASDRIAELPSSQLCA